MFNWATIPVLFELDWIHQALHLIKQDQHITMERLQVFVYLLNYEWFLHLQQSNFLTKGIFIFAQWAENWLNYALLSELRLGIIVSPKTVSLDILRNCLCIKLKLAVVIICKIMRRSADRAVRNGVYIGIIFSPLFPAKRAFCLKRRERKSKKKRRNMIKELGAMLLCHILQKC